MGVRIDKIHASSMFESFKNYLTVVTPITISGSIPPGGKAFEIEIPYDRLGSIADIYIHKQGTDYKRSTNSTWRILDFVGSADVQAGIYLQYTNTSIIATIYVTNFGVGAFAVATQVYEIQMVIFDAPLPH